MNATFAGLAVLTLFAAALSGLALLLFFYAVQAVRERVAAAAVVVFIIAAAVCYAAGSVSWLLLPYWRQVLG